MDLLLDDVAVLHHLDADDEAALELEDARGRHADGVRARELVAQLVVGWAGQPLRAEAPDVAVQVLAVEPLEERLAVLDQEVGLGVLVGLDGDHPNLDAVVHRRDEGPLGGSLLSLAAGNPPLESLRYSMSHIDLMV